MKNTSWTVRFLGNMIESVFRCRYVCPFERLRCSSCVPGWCAGMPAGSREQGAPLFHFQVPPAAVQSHFNTNCFLPDKCACALRLTPPVSACNATLVAVDTKYQPLSQPQSGTKTKNYEQFLRWTLADRVCTYRLSVRNNTRRQLCWSFSSSAHWLWPAGLRSLRKKMSWCWRKVTSKRLWKLTQTSWLNSVSKNCS